MIERGMYLPLRKSANGEGGSKVGRNSASGPALSSRAELVPTIAFIVLFSILIIGLVQS